jgi:hypothetical protein
LGLLHVMFNEDYGLQAFSQLVDVVPEEQLTQVLLPALLRKAEDPVPNVKFNVSKVLQVCVNMASILALESLNFSFNITTVRLSLRQSTGVHC